MAWWMVSAILLVTALPVPGQQAAPKKPSELVVGKLVHVEPMPANLDQWILEYLRVWGKYKLTGDPEGVDLIIRVDAPEKPPEYESRAGIPQPRQKRQGPVAISVSVVDWVTGETLWHADLIDQKPKKGELEPPPGPRTRVSVRGLTTSQMAQKLVTRLSEYVAMLEKTLAGSTPPKSH